MDQLRDFTTWCSERWPRLLADMGVPDQLTSASSDQIDTARWNPVMEAFAAGQSLYLHGETGRGKSYLAAAILRAKLESTVNLLRTDESFADAAARYTSPYRFEVADDILHAMRRTFNDKSSDQETDTDIIDRLSNYRVLVLDDFGVSKPTEWALQTLDSIIDWRYRTQRQRQTIITSNFNLDDLGRLYQDRIASRIAGMCAVFSVNGSDRRRPA